MAIRLGGEGLVVWANRTPRAGTAAKAAITSASKHTEARASLRRFMHGKQGDANRFLRDYSCRPDALRSLARKAGSTFSPSCWASLTSAHALL